MTRLTTDIRGSIARAATEKAFSKETEQLVKEENGIALELYASIFDEKTIRAAKRMPAGWVRMDECLRFNCEGYDLTMRTLKAVPVPTSNGCARLGNIAGELAGKAQDFARKKQELRERRNAAYRALETMLNSVSTAKALEKAWPEGKPFYAKYLISAPGSNLPALQVEKINEMLGLVKEAT